MSCFHVNKNTGRWSSDQAAVPVMQNVQLLTTVSIENRFVVLQVNR